MERAVILLSGGLDSAVCLAKAARQDRSTFCITFNYGQKHEREIESARKLARVFNADGHMVFDIDLKSIGGSSLVDDSPVPVNRDMDNGEIPSTYVPARNTIFLSIALGWAEVLGAREIWTGVNEVDTSGYPDTRPEFIEAFEKMALTATRMTSSGDGIRIVAPLTGMDKGGIVGLGKKLGLDFSLTWSCYNPQPGGRVCGACDSCRLRARGFDQAGVSDPLASTFEKMETCGQ